MTYLKEGNSRFHYASLLYIRIIEMEFQHAFPNRSLGTREIEH